MLQRDILLLEFVRAVYNYAFSVNFIIDRFSLPYLFHDFICTCFIILFLAHVSLGFFFSNGYYLSETL